MISIIVPVYHVENELRRCLDSILAQSYKDFELILINDGGNEVETAICEQYAEQDSRIVYRYQNNRGLSAARNHGLELSRGEWIMFVDSDDWVNEEFCRKAYEAVNVSCAQMAIFDLAYTQGNERSGTVHASQIEAGVYPSEEILRLRLSGKIQGYAWNKIYNRSLWKGIRFPEKELWEDDAVMHELIDAAKQIAVIHDVLYYKPYRAECITSIAKENGEENKWLFIQRKRRYLYLKEHHPVLYNQLAFTGKLQDHLIEVNECCTRMKQMLVAETAKKQGLTEKLKARDQLAWVGMMNNIDSSVEEFILSEYVYG